MIDFGILKELILSNKSFLITTHVNPDADAIGSEVAMYLMLEKLGKEAKVINHSLTPYNLEFLDVQKRIEQYHPEKHLKYFQECDVLIALDFNRSDRTVSMKDAFNASSKLKICIDHHLDPENFADHYFIDTEYSATGHIIYDFIQSTDIIKLTSKIALPLYAAIMTDTGSFRFERTTPELHRIAANLLETGVVPGEVYDNIYDQSKFSKIRLLGRALDSMKLTGLNNQIGYMVLRRNDFIECEAIESDTENFVNYALSVENVVIGLLFLELKQGFKVSFRSKGNIPINKLASIFGGGGHLNAAGARLLDGNMTEFIPVILAETEKFL